jgi:hypothetical protein
MVGKILITRTGYDPELGKHVKDPYLGPCPTMGACRPDIRRKLREGDHIFVISGKIPGASQYVMGGFEIESKIDAREAYRLFPELRLRRREDGQLTGNIIVDAKGNQHKLDDHSSFEGRIKHYVIGKNLVSLTAPCEVADGRRETLDVLRDILHKKGDSPFVIIGRGGADLTENQVSELRTWLASLKHGNAHML